MLEYLKGFFTKHIALKILSLILALLVWFYIVSELDKGSDDELKMLRKLLPSEALVAKKLPIKPVLVSKPHKGYIVNRNQVIMAPEYCIVVGTRDMLGKLKNAYTMPIDLRGSSKPFTTSIPLNPIAPGVYMEETLVQVTVPVEKEIVQ